MKNNMPAFPSHASLGNLSIGMTLRDYFAGQALSGLCANESYIRAIAEDEELSDKDKPNKLAEICYELADAMLAQREKE